MKKNLLLVGILGLMGSALLFNGCKKDDTAAPIITLNGSNPDQIVLNSGTYADPSASANDEEDGTVSVSSTYSAANPDVSTAGSYTIDYSATDAAGNTGSASRVVNVVIDRSNYIWAGYAADDSSTTNSIIGGFTYTGSISAASAGDQIIITNFSGSGANAVATVNGGTVTIASQTVGALTNVSGTGTMNNKGTIITLDYVATENSVTDSFQAVFAKQ